MSGKFFRAPGATVTYTPQQTRNYVSRKARLSRGLNMTPTRRSRSGDGWLFYFQSPRGPRVDRGSWKVEVVRFEADGGGGEPGGGGGGGGGGSGLPACPPPGTTLNHLFVGWYAFAQGFEIVSQSGSGYVNAAIASSVASAAGYSDGSVGVGNSFTEGPFSHEEWYYTFDEDGSMTFLAATITLSTTNPSPAFSGLWDTWKLDDRHELPGFILVRVTGPNGFLAEDPNGLSSPYCDDGSSTPPPPPPPGPTGPPPGFLPGEGPWAYKCNCPDYSGDEPAYNVPLAPSHRKARAFALARPLSPCKHIASAAQALHDQKTLVKWARQYAGDSPGREYTEGPRITYDDSLNQANQAAENAFRRTIRDTNKAFAKQQAQQRAAQSARRLSEKLGRMNRWNVIEGTGRAQITSSRDVGRFGEPLNLDVASRNLRNNWAADRYQEQYQRDYDRYMNRPDVRVRNALGNAKEGAGNFINNQIGRVWDLSGEPMRSIGNPPPPSRHMFDTEGGRAVTEAMYGEGMRRVGTFNPTLIPTIRFPGPAGPPGAPTAGSIGPSIKDNPEAYGY